MKFLYEYRTSDNVKHDGVVNAASRDAAFAALKARGVRPSRLVEAPGVLNNLFGKGKRWLAIGVLTISLGCALAALVATRSDQVPQQVAESVLSSFDAPTRRQVIGDAAIIDFGVHTGWANVFAHEGDRFLASFAVPGVPAGIRNTSENEIVAALSRKVGPEPGDGLEARQIKAMVEGMKDEVRAFLAAGGTIVEYGQRLVERQETELRYYQRAQNEIDALVREGRASGELMRLWEDRNAKLRGMGIRLLPLPRREFAP